jgi:hypothetical protein
VSRLPISVLFTGHAPVHFVCFRPLFERLRRHPGFDVYLSGGLKSQDEAGQVRYDHAALYQPFGVEPDRVLPVADLAERDFDVLFGANTNILAPRSAQVRIQIFHGVSFRNKAIRRENLSHDFYFLIGPYMRRTFIAKGMLSDGDPRGLDIGFLKTDRLLDGSLDRGALRRGYGLAGDRPLVLYAPTGQRHNSLETMGEEVIRRIAAAGRYDLVVKLHDHPKNTGVDWPARLRELEDAHTRLAGELDVIPLLACADLLITDASSVSSEFSLLDRPMVFLDVPRLLEKASADPDSSLDLETWGRRGGDLVAGPDQVVAAVDDALAAPARHSEVRRAMAQDLFFNPGHATEAAMSWLLRTFGRAPA